jgi:quinol-cytochrome oxidoreductase complex cytochrome b subunit
LPSTTNTGVMGSIYKANDWLKTRFKNIDIFDEHYQREAKTNPFYSLGSIFYLVWFIVMATGLVLMMWYIPTKAAAFDSILKIQHHIPFGNLMRGIHKYGADAMIIAATLRMFRMFLAGDYKPGKEFNIAIGLVTLLLSMYSGLTGYLLIWNQRAFWATKVFATFPTYMDQFPVMGDFYLPLVKSMHMGWNTAEFLLGAGGAITQETITRFFSLHLAFSLIPLIFVELYYYKTGFTRINLSWLQRTIVGGMLLVVAIVLPAAIGARSNPDVTPLPILSDWYFLGLYQMYKYLEPVVATEMTLVIPLSVVLLPFIDVAITGAEKNIWKRPLVFMTAMMGLINWLVFSILIIVNIANIHNDPPYWRDAFYLMIDIGIIWQLALLWSNRDPVAKLRSAGGAMVMAVVAGIQTLLGVAYYYMARAEMFLDPLMHSFTYFLFRPFMGGNADKAEDLVRAAMKDAPEYWHYQYTLVQPPMAGVTNPPVLNSIAEVSKQGTPLDFIFQLIPSFTTAPDAIAAKSAALAKHAPDFWVVAAKSLDHPDYAGLPWYQYQGMIDYMVTNRWMQDYVTFCDRMNGKIAPYPAAVPDLDWIWMVAGPITLAACLWVWMNARKPLVKDTTSPPEKVAAGVS